MLSAQFVDRIFARLLVRYGAAWVNLWKGIPMDAVQADWASELSGLSAESIKHALDHLPIDRPPNVGQFRALCVGAPQAHLPELPPPEATPERKAEVRQLLSLVRAKLTA